MLIALSALKKPVLSDSIQCKTRGRRGNRQCWMNFDKGDRKMNFDLETSRKILKIVGILTIIGAVLSLITGVLLLAGGGYASANLPEAQTDPDTQTGIGAMFAGGIFIIIAGIFSLVSGIISVKASKQNKYGKIAWIFAIIGAVLAVLRGFSSVSSNPGLSSIAGALLNIALNVMIFFAANTIKTAYAAEKQ